MIEKSSLEILEELGYRLFRRSGYYQTAAIYRGGNDTTSVAIYPNNEVYVDFVTGEKGKLQNLIAKTIGIEEKDLPNWLHANRYILSQKKEEAEIDKQPIILDPKETLSILPIHDHWLNRGISLETLQVFRGGEIRIDHPLKDRYVNPIYNSRKELIGLSGRTLVNAKNKYKHIGDRSLWCFPAFVNSKLLINNTIILVESIGCLFSLWEMGIKNVLCLFGIYLNRGILNFIIKSGCKGVVISTNNEESMRGNNAADEIKAILSNIMNPNQIKIKLPYMKDFNEMLISNKNSILDWQNALN